MYCIWEPKGNLLPNSIRMYRGKCIKDHIGPAGKWKKWTQHGWRREKVQVTELPGKKQL